MSNVIPRRPGMMFERRERAIGMFTVGMSAKDVARHFQQIDNKSTTEQISVNWERRGPTQIRQTA